MIRGRLQDATDYKLMTIKECLDALGWNYVTNGDRFEEITCPCSNIAVEFSGFVGTDHLECPKCGKFMTDMFSPLQVTSGSCIVLSSKEWEMDDERRHWIANNKAGGIKINT
ncbi:hypothetical protein [Bacteroides sp.]|uniref:hypothetical protein n=1 Tax=Bacteroides sp. TaxID=29523 RepID=UPI002631DE99|nr:hypothetical protein [Bacteroides sp.]MDD3041246.1 hypothetical protein [Bacteroides sp.]